jgi:hypothetical protein
MFDCYPFLRFEETTSTLAGSRQFTLLDCFSDFCQINIHEPHCQKSDFTVPGGQYEFSRMPRGISNRSASHQWLMDRVLKHLTGPECWIFIDDVLIFSDTVEKRARRLRHVLERFEKANLQLEPSKCDSAKDPVTHYPAEWWKASQKRWRLFKNTQPQETWKLSEHFWVYVPSIES